MDKTIYNYISGEKRGSYGVIAATKMNDTTVTIGWSICNKKDQFSKKLGKKIALNRSTKDKNLLDNHEWLSLGDLEGIVGITYSRIKHAIKDANFVDRINRYFKVPSSGIFVSTSAHTKKTYRDSFGNAFNPADQDIA